MRALQFATNPGCQVSSRVIHGPLNAVGVRILAVDLVAQLDRCHRTHGSRWLARRVPLGRWRAYTRLQPASANVGDQHTGADDHRRDSSRSQTSQ